MLNTWLNPQRSLNKIMFNASSGYIVTWVVRTCIHIIAVACLSSAPCNWFDQRRHSRGPGLFPSYILKFKTSASLPMAESQAKMDVSAKRWWLLATTLCERLGWGGMGLPWGFPSEIGRICRNPGRPGHDSDTRITRILTVP